MNAGNSALVNYSLIPVRDPEGAFDAVDQLWADADVEHAAEWLRRLAADPDLRASMGARAAVDVNAQLSPDRFVRTVEALLDGDYAALKGRVT